MNTRSHVKLAVGQVWQSSDPRRLSAFELITIGPTTVYVATIYPLTGRLTRILPRAKFLQLGSKGYRRIS